MSGNGPPADRPLVTDQHGKADTPLTTHCGHQPASDNFGVKECLLDHATPNLPSRDFEATAQFYERLGFEEGWRDQGWMILKRGDLTVEFFPHAELDPATGNFSCCLRLDDMPAFCDLCKSAGLPEQCWGWPRLHPASEEASGKTIAYMVDLDGSLVRLIQN